MPDHEILREICPKLRIWGFYQSRPVLWSTVFRDVTSQDSEFLNEVVKTYLLCAEIVCRVWISLQTTKNMIFVAKPMKICSDSGSEVLRIWGFYRSRPVLWQAVLRDMISQDSKNLNEVIKTYLLCAEIQRNPQFVISDLIFRFFRTDHPKF